MWVTDITEHPTREGKLYFCAVKDVFSNRIIGYAAAPHMGSALAVSALNTAVARRHINGYDVAGCIVHSNRASSEYRHQYPEERRAQQLIGACQVFCVSGGLCVRESVWVVEGEFSEDGLPVLGCSSLDEFAACAAGCAVWSGGLLGSFACSFVFDVGYGEP